MTSCVELHKVRYGNDPRSYNVGENDDMQKNSGLESRCLFLCHTKITVLFLFFENRSGDDLSLCFCLYNLTSVL